MPFVNAWGPDLTSMFAIRHDATVRGEAVFRDDERETVPDFTKQSPQRQRWCMAHGWCQVCGHPVAWKNRRLVVSNISLEIIDVHARPHLALTEPWLCEADAELAVERCPGLIRRRRDEDLEVIRPERRDVALARSLGWIEGPLEEYSRSHPVVMWLKILIRVSALPDAMTLRVKDRRDAVLQKEAEIPRTNP